MKQLFTLLLFSLTCSVFATTKTTVSDGSWFDANNWNPIGVPLSEDTVVIDHDIIVSGDYVDFGANWLIVSSGASIVCDTTFALHGNLRLFGLMDIKTFAIGDGDSTNIYGTLTGEKFAAGNPTNINYGLILSDTLIAGDTFDNFGLIDVDYFVIGGPAFINHSSAAIVVSDQCTFSTTGTNEVNATMVIGYLVTEGALTNNGDISITNWTHGSGIANGTGGRYCISDCFINVDEISGTVDVCDATPGGFCDNDFGTIAGTVTFCAVGSCTNNVGINEVSVEPNIYPNPTSDIVQINNLIAGSSYQLIDAKGNLVYSGIILSETTVLNLANVETGVYFLKVQTADQSTISKIIRN